MGQQQPALENKKFGRYLRKIREDRRLSLDAVEEMTLGYPEPVTKSHLSRIENGQAVPTFPRMYALSQIYGVPIASLAERFEIDLRRFMAPSEVADNTYEDVMAQCRTMYRSGRYAEALRWYEALLDRFAGDAAEGTEEFGRQIDLRLHRVTCLVHLARYSVAKDECEELLGLPGLSPRQRVQTLQYFTMCCYRLCRFTVALMGLEQAEKELGSVAPAADELEASLRLLKGNLMFVTGRFDEATVAYTEALNAFQALEQHFEACRVRINLGETQAERGQLNEARKNLGLAVEQARKGGFDRQLAHAKSSLGWIAFKKGDLDAAESHLLQSNGLARAREYYSVTFRNCYYLWKIARQRGDAAGERSNERTLRTYLSRVEQYLPEAEAYRQHLAGGDR